MAAYNVIVSRLRVPANILAKPPNQMARGGEIYRPISLKSYILSYPLALTCHKLSEQVKSGQPVIDVSRRLPYSPDDDDGERVLVPSGVWDAVVCINLDTDRGGNNEPITPIISLATHSISLPGTPRKMKDISVIIPTVNLANLTRSPSVSTPCSPTSNKHSPRAYEYDGCMLCVNSTPCCLQKRRATWTLKLRVALYCLSVLHPDKKYFNLKKDIYSYVDNHWDLLSINTAKSDRWRKQVQDSLSHCRHFESGWDAMGCNGHWRLIQPLNPWSFPPEREGSIMEEDEPCFTPEASLSPRPSKSPREDPLYRNFPKRRPMIGSAADNDSDFDNRNKRKMSDVVQELPTEEELVMLKYSPMIFSDTPSPKCRTPRSATSSTTSPSIIGHSPMLASSGTYFTLSNFSNNLTLNGSSSGLAHSHPHQHSHHMAPTSSLATSSITILESSPSSPSDRSNDSPVSSPRLSTSSPPIPSVPFSWKNGSGTAFKTTSLSNVPNTSLLLSDHCSKSSSSSLPNPFSGPPSPKFSTPSPNFFTGASTLKVPTDLLIKTTNLPSSGSSPLNSPSASSSPTSSTGSAPNLSKIQQQNLILNCTY
eukprot:gene1479-1717_t